jgi:hypothetical protein
MTTLGFDFESHLIGPDLCPCGEVHDQLPPAVCLSYALPAEGGGVISGVVLAAEGIAMLAEALDDPDVHFVGAETSFDVLISCVNASLAGLTFEDMITKWVAAYNAGRVHDVCVRQKLLDLAAGSYRWQRFSDGRAIRIGYDLATTAKRLTGRALSKPTKEDAATHPRLRYATVDGVPVEQWPPGFREYAEEDAVAALETYLAQEKWRESDQGQWIAELWQHHADLWRKLCGAPDNEVDPFLDAQRQTCHALWLKAMSAEGLRTDAKAVAIFKKHVEAEYVQLCQEVRGYGLVRREYKRDLKRMRAEGNAYAKNAAWRELKEALESDDPEALEVWAELRAQGLVSVKHVKNMNDARRMMFEWCSTRGLDIPHTEKWRPNKHSPSEYVAIDSDACRVSECPELIAYAELVHAGKVLTTDIKRLVEGTERPLHTHFEVCLETGRTSSADPNVQNRARGEGKTVKLRDGTEREGRPGDRECFVPPEGHVFVDCLAPGTRILKADLTWVPIETLRSGDELIGFDEELKGRNTKYRSSRVEAVGRSKHPCYRITTTRGTVVASDSHMWVARTPHRGGRGVQGIRRWIKSKDLRVGDLISFFAAPWDVESSPEQGYLAGFFDGEGDTSRGGVGFGQNPGPVLEHVCKLLAARGYDLRDSNAKRLCRVLRISGGAAEACRFLGSIRPLRLLAKARCHWDGAQTWGKRSVPAEILSIEFLGEQETISVKTSTRTFIAEGFLSHNCDYPQLEMFCLAQVCRWVLGYSTLGDALLAGLDPHTSFATLIQCAGDATRRIPYAEAERILKDKKHPLYQELKNCRDAAKGCNFGKPGGLGAKTMVSYAAKSYGVVLPEERWQEILDLWDQQWPEMPDYFAFIETLADGIDYGKDAEGRPIRKFNVPQAWSGRLRAGASFCAACNSWYQGLGADVAKRAGWYIFQACYVPDFDAANGASDGVGLLGCMPQNFIHDQFLVAAPEARAQIAAERVEYWMRRAAIELMPDYGPAMAAKTVAILARRWSKGAEEVRNADGSLGVWEDKRLALALLDDFSEGDSEAEEESEEAA